MAAVFSTGAGTFEKTEKRFDRLRSLTEKIVAIQNASAGRVVAESKSSSSASSSTSRFAFRVAKARVRCRQHYFLNGFEKLQLTEAQLSERRHALAQKLIGETLRQSDRSLRRRRRRLTRVIRKKTILAPFMACIRWLSEPLVRLARIASLAAAKVEQSSKKSARVSSFPVDDHSPLLLESS